MKTLRQLLSNDEINFLERHSVANDFLAPPNKRLNVEYGVVGLCSECDKKGPLIMFTLSKQKPPSEAYACFLCDECTRSVYNEIGRYLK